MSEIDLSKRMAVDIKRPHRKAVYELMKRLGGVSSADAIAFLIQTQMPAALARLNPSTDFSAALATPQAQTAPSPKPHPAPGAVSEADDVLSMILST